MKAIDLIRKIRKDLGIITYNEERINDTVLSLIEDIYFEADPEQIYNDICDLILFIDDARSYVWDDLVDLKRAFYHEQFKMGV